MLSRPGVFPKLVYPFQNILIIASELRENQSILEATKAFLATFLNLRRLGNKEKSLHTCINAMNAAIPNASMMNGGALPQIKPVSGIKWYIYRHQKVCQVSFLVSPPIIPGLVIVGFLGLFRTWRYLPKPYATLDLNYPESKKPDTSTDGHGSPAFLIYHLG